MEPEGVKVTRPTNSFLVSPFVPESAAQSLPASPRKARRPQFTNAASTILSRIKGNNSAQERAIVDTQTKNCHGQGISARELTLHLPWEMPPVDVAPGAESFFDNDDSFETSNVDFTQDSIPFRPPLVPVVKDDLMTDAPPEISREEAIEAKRREWLAGLPEGVLPAKSELVGFAAGPEAQASSLTNYFYGKPKTDLLNILSFCDQLKPQLLVDIFVSISMRHPELPVFNAPDWEEKVREEEAARIAAVAAVQARNRIHQRSRHGHTLLNPRMRQKRKGIRTIVKVSTTTTGEQTSKTIILREENVEVDDVLPPAWPKAGEGLYATLSLEDEDTLYLADEGDDDAFSHFMVDSLGNLTGLAACG